MLAPSAAQPVAAWLHPAAAAVGYLCRPRAVRSVRARSRERTAHACRQLRHTAGSKAGGGDAYMEGDGCKPDGQRRQFAARLLSALGEHNDGAKGTVYLRFEAPQPSRAEQNALAALCEHAQTQLKRRPTDSADEAEDETLSIPAAFLSKPFELQQIGPERKCKLWRDDLTRTFSNKVSWSRGVDSLSAVSRV
jgi:hypothetical protein